MQEKSITIYDIAKQANVSPATVSRVLTGNAKVSSEKKKLILTIMEKNNFHPNALARGLINKATKSIGFIVPDITNPFFSATFLEAEKCAVQLGYTIILCNSMNDNRMNQTGMESLYLKMLCEKQVDGIIIMGGRANEKISSEEQIRELQDITQKTPVVFINGTMSGVKSYHVETNEKQGILELVDYLVKLGHKKIGFIGGRKGITSTDAKIFAFAKALQQFNIPYYKEWIIPSSFSIDDGYVSMQKLLKLSNYPTAVLAVNDFTAIGAINAAQDFGLMVPQDISIAGFDGTYLTNMVRPRITTVSQNYDELGSAAVDLIANLAKGKKVKRKILIDTKIMIKDSCAAPKTSI